MTGEVYQALKTTDFDLQKAIDKLNADRQRQKKKPANNAASEILDRFGLESDPEDDAEEKPGNHIMEVHDHPKQRVAPSSKRASPIPDPRAENQMSKRPRRNAQQKSMANNSRATAIVIHDEEDEISGSSQQLPPPSQEPPRAFTNGVGLPPHLPARPSSLDSITDPIEPEMMDVDSAHPTPCKRPVLFSNNSPPASINPVPPKARPPPRTTQPAQAPITDYMQSMLTQRRGVDQIASMPSHSNRDVWRNRHRLPTPGLQQHSPDCKDTPSSEDTSTPASPPQGKMELVSEIITTGSSDSEEQDEAEEPALPQIDLGVAILPKKVRHEVFNNDSSPIYSSPFPHRKTSQGNSEVETLPKHNNLPALLLSGLKKGKVRGRKASPETEDDAEEISEAISVKPNFDSTLTLPASLLKRKEKRSTIEVLIEKGVQGADGRSKPRAENRGGRAPWGVRYEIPSSQPSPPPISRPATPDLGLDPVEEEEVQEVTEAHGGMRETRHKRTGGQTRRARQSSSGLSELSFIPSSPDRPKRKQDVKVVDNCVDSSDSDDDDTSDVEQIPLPPAAKKSSSSKPKRSTPKGRRVAIARGKPLGNGKRVGKEWVDVYQNEEGGEQQEKLKQREEAVMNRERKRKVGRA